MDCRIGRAIKFLLYVTVIATLAGGRSLLAQSDAFSPRSTKPRIAPVPEQGRNEAQRQMLASRPDYNIYKTLAHHPELYAPLVRPRPVHAERIEPAAPRSGDRDAAHGLAVPVGIRVGAACAHRESPTRA